MHAPLHVLHPVSMIVIHVGRVLVSVFMSKAIVDQTVINNTLTHNYRPTMWAKL